MVAYDCVVCVKQVPDTAHVAADAMTPEGTVNRAALPAVFNPEDLHALEVALAVRDEYGGRVTVISMGPPKAADVLRDCLYRGADRVILVTDRRAAARHPGHQLHSQPGDPHGREIRSGFLRAPGDRWGHRSGRAADR